MMSLESTGSRCEQMAQQMLIFGHPLTTAEQIERIEAIDRLAVQQSAAQIFSGQPTIAAIGPVKQIMEYDRLVTPLAN